MAWEWGAWQLTPWESLAQVPRGLGAQSRGEGSWRRALGTRTCKGGARERGTAGGGGAEMRPQLR